MYIALSEEYYLWHILPSNCFLRADTKNKENNDTLNKIKNEYNEIILYEIAKKLVANIFGNDICKTIMDYYNAIKIDF